MEGISNRFKKKIGALPITTSKNRFSPVGTRDTGGSGGRGKNWLCLMQHIKQIVLFIHKAKKPWDVRLYLKPEPAVDTLCSLYRSQSTAFYFSSQHMAFYHRNKTSFV